MTTTQNDNRFPIAIIAAVVVILVWMLTGCRTVEKIVTKTEYIKDSSSIIESDSLRRILHDKEMELATERSESKEADVIFDTVPCPDKPNTVEVKPDGSMIFSGNIKKANTNSQSANREFIRLKERYDSVLQVKNKVETKVVTKYIHSKSSTTRKFPWLWSSIGAIILIVIGAISEYKFKWVAKIKRFIKL